MAEALGSAGDVAARHPGAVLGVARFFRAPRRSMRGVIESRPGEGRLFAYALGAGVILLLGRLPVLLAEATAGGVGADLPGRLGAQATALLFFVPLLYYALAALGTWIARSFGGVGGWRDGRVAFFWGALVSAPVMVLSSLVPLTMPGAPDMVRALIAQAGPVFFAWALAQCYAEAFGFRRASMVLAVILVIALAVLALGGLARI